MTGGKSAILESFRVFFNKACGCGTMFGADGKTERTYVDARRTPEFKRFDEEYNAHVGALGAKPDGSILYDCMKENERQVYFRVTNDQSADSAEKTQWGPWYLLTDDVVQKVHLQQGKRYRTNSNPYAFLHPYMPGGAGRDESGAVTHAPAGAPCFALKDA